MGAINVNTSTSKTATFANSRETHLAKIDEFKKGLKIIFSTEASENLDSRYEYDSAKYYLNSAYKYVLDNDSDLQKTGLKQAFLDVIGDVAKQLKEFINNWKAPNVPNIGVMNKNEGVEPDYAKMVYGLR